MTLIRGRYELIGGLGAGAQGTALEVRDHASGTDRLVLKVFEPAQADLALRAFDVLTQLASPFLPQVHALFMVNPADMRRFADRLAALGVEGVRVREGQACLVRSYVQGTPIDTWIADRPYSESAPVLWQFALMVADLHRAGFLHGDLKPDNVLIDPQSLPVLIDFGLSQRAAGAVQGGGTPLYLAPEIFRGESPSPASERYAFGAVVFALLQGHPPFGGQTTGTVTRGHLEAPVPELDAAVPARVKSVVRRLLSKQPDDRPGLDEVCDVLRPPGAVDHRHAVLPFEGRDAVLAAVLERLADGQPAWISGPSGLGKTRLLQHVRWHAEARGLTTLVVPPGPLGLEDKLRTVGRQLSGLLGLDPPPLPRTLGDRVHQRRALARWLDAQVPHPPPLLFWDGADLTPDHLAFLREYDRIGGALPFLAAVAGSEGLSGPGHFALDALPAQAAEACVRSAGARLGLTAAAQRRAVIQARGNPRALQRALSDAAARPELAESGDRTPLLVLLGSAPVPIPLTALARALDEPFDQVWARLQPLLHSGVVARIGEGFTLARPLDALAVCAGAEAEHLGRLSAAVEQAGLHRSSAALRVLSGDLSPGLLTAALGATAEEQRDDFAFHLVGAVVAAGELDQIPRLVGLATELDQVAVALSYLESPDAPRVHLARARLHYTLGRLDEAACDLGALESLTLSVNQWAESATLGAWVALRQGRFKLAAERLEAAPEPRKIGDPAVAAELATAMAATALLTGASQAPARFRLAQELLDSAGGMPELAARLLTFQAMAATRAGDLQRAKDLYEEALQIVEGAGLDAHLPLFLLNAATAHDHLGKLAEARRYYRRGARLAGEHVGLSTRLLLLANQANVSLRVSLLDEAQELLAQARELVGTDNDSRAALFVRQLEGELATRVGRFRQARETLDALCRHFRQTGDHNALAEVALWSARARLSQGDWQAADDALTEASGLIDELGFNDLKPLALVVEGELFDRRGAIDEAVERWAAAVEIAARTGDPFRVLEAASLHQRALALPAHHLATVTWALGQVADGLGPSLRSSYFASLPEEIPKLLEPSLARTTLGTSAAPPGGHGAEEKLYRLLSLTAQLARETDYDRFLDRAVDTAIELAGAERGFLLLAEPAGFRVAVSRDVDGEPIRRAILKVSSTIAEQVAASREPLVTVDAQSDNRFEAARSVHQMALTSVLCLPLRAFGRVMAVIYLDHRFRPAAFDDQVVRLMSAFADQLAVAMLYIDRVRALENRNRDLEAAQERAKSLLDDTEQMADRLRDRCQSLESDLESQRRSTSLRFRYESIVANTPAMRSVLQQVDRLVDSSIAVLVAGESGTGKELVARAIHFNGARREAPFIPINCGAMPEALLESELFGHKKGAFTGADRDHPGLFAAADGGTVFLDEAGELPASAQVKLLRVLQEKRVRPVGAVQDRELDVRVIAATNRDLLQMVEAGDFRSDLYYRLAGVVLEIPALRDRREDIPPIVEHILSGLAADADREVAVTAAAMRLLYQHAWPGNVRQLENVLQAALALSGGDRIGTREIKPLLQSRGRRAGAARVRRPSAGRRGPKPRVKPDELREALRDARGNVKRAAEILSVTPRSVYRYMARWGIEL